jgi:hypothetical protein
MAEALAAVRLKVSFSSKETTLSKVGVRSISGRLLSWIMSAATGVARAN